MTDAGEHAPKSEDRLRHPAEPDFRTTMTAVRRRVGRARAGGLVGSAGGLVIAGVLTVLVRTADGQGPFGPVQDVGLALEVLAAGLIGTAFGQALGLGRVRRLLQVFLGYGRDTQQVHALLRGEEVDAEDAVRTRAARFAALAFVARSALLRCHLLYVAELLTMTVSTIALSPTPDASSLVLLALPVLLLSSVMIRRRGVAQARRYRETHPVAEDGSELAGAA